MDVTRRDLLKGFGAAAAAAGAGLLSDVALAHGGEEEGVPVPPSSSRVRQWVMVIDQRACDGCAGLGVPPQCTQACNWSRFVPRPAGLSALRSTRMEKKYPLYGLDVNDTTSPLEANLAWAVDVDKDGYIGRDALCRQRDDGVSRLLVGIEFPDLSFVPVAGDVVSLDGKDAGTVTSSDRGYFLGKALAMGYLLPETVGSRVVVRSADGSSAEGIVTDRAFHDPDGTRVRT